MIVDFVDFVGIIDHRCLNFLFIIRRVKTEKQQTVIVIRSFNTEISTSLVHNSEDDEGKVRTVCHYGQLLLLERSIRGSSSLTINRHGEVTICHTYIRILSNLY